MRTLIPVIHVNAWNGLHPCVICLHGVQHRRQYSSVPHRQAKAVYFISWLSIYMCAHNAIPAKVIPLCSAPLVQNALNFTVKIYSLTSFNFEPEKYNSLKTATKSVSAVRLHKPISNRNWLSRISSQFIVNILKRDRSQPHNQEKQHFIL